MSLDLIAAVILGAIAAGVAATLAAGAARAVRPRLLLTLAAWFAAVLTAGAAGAFAGGTALLGGTAALGLLGAAVALIASPSLRSGLGAIPLPALIAVHVGRLLGVFFVLLYFAGRLPAPFAPSAGWGDIAVAAAAPAVAWLAWRRAGGWRPLLVAWNSVGLADLLVAVALGITSAPDTSFRLFFAAPGAGLMGTLPWVLIPTFLVPLYIVLHVATFVRLRRPAARPAFTTAETGGRPAAARI